MTNDELRNLIENGTTPPVTVQVVKIERGAMGGPGRIMERWQMACLALLDRIEKLEAQNDRTPRPPGRRE